VQRCPICSEAAQFWCRAPDLHYGNAGVWEVYRCGHCRHAFQHPLPKEEDLLQYYPASYYAHQPPDIDFTPRGLHHRGVWLKLHYLKYFRGYQHLPVFANPILARLGLGLEHRPLHFDAPVFQPGGILLDYGSGSGNAVAFARFIGWTAEGIEIDPDAAKAGRDAGVNIDHGSIETLEGRIDRYNYVMSSHCVEHVADVWKLFRVFFKALKPGGILAIDMPNADSIAAEYFRDFYYYLCMPVHVNLFTPMSIRLLAESTGFADISIATYSRWSTQMESAILIGRARQRKSIQAGFHSYNNWECLFGRIESLPVLIWSLLRSRGDCLVMTCMKPEFSQS
jgi:SAM-dependent methyltransferase